MALLLLATASLIDYLGGGVALGDGLQGPVFLQEPPHRADFSNSTGLALHCSAHGNPPPAISWLVGDGQVARDVPGLRRSLANGTLLLPPFAAEEYRPDVHGAAYRCLAASSLGAILSRRVQVRAVVKQFYELQVYDEFVVLGNTAVLRCHVPSFVRDYVAVTSWVRGARERITADVSTGGRYSVFASGELHIRHVTHADGALAYRCEARHRLTGETRLSTVSGRLLVTEPQSSVPPRITDSRSHVTARLREPAELPCAAQGFPLPTYTWYRGRGGQSVAVTTDERVMQVGGSLFLRSAQLEDSGRYTCVVNNSVGSERASTSLLVTKQLSAYMSPQVQVVDVGKAALFNCTTDGHPKQSVVWLKDAQLLTPSSRVRLLASETLKIVHVERSDRGMYQCVVSNSEETAQGTAQLKLGDAAPVLVRTFGNATLPPGAPWSAQCEASGSPAPAVSWRLDGAPLESSAGGEHAVAVSNRVTADGVLSYLNVSALAPLHGGRYACAATNAVGSVTHQAYLHVIGPPYIKPMQDRRVVAGTTVKFNCYVTGYPISSIYWEKDGRPLTDTQRQTLFPNGTLLINDIRKGEDEGGYVCVARNPDGDTARRKLNVQVLEAPEIDPIMVKPNLQRGMRIHLTCIISKGDFPVAIHWLKDGKAIPHGQSITEKTIDDYSSTLSFNGLVVKHSGNYTCQASNAAAVTNYTVTVIVNVPPAWRHEPNDTEVVLGNSLMVDCAADGSPLPSIQWRKESPLPRSPFQNIQRMENFKVLENGSLWIQHVAIEDKGYYVCEANSGIGLGLSKGIYITVHVPARFSLEFRNVTAKKDSTAILDCVAEGDKPLKVQWIQASLLVKPDHVKLDIKEEHLDFGMRSKMTIKHVQRDDTASFGCLASNQYGSDRMEFQLIVQENPEPPVNVHLINFSSRSVNISWEMPYDGNSPIHTFIIQIKNTSGSWSKDVRRVSVSGDQKGALVVGLQPAHSYQLRVLAENTVGTSNASDVVSVTTAEEVPGGPPRDVRIKVRNSEALLVSWKPPESHLQHGEITGYHVGYRLRNSTEPFMFKTYEVIPGTDLQVTLSNLRKFTEYSIVVQAYNRAGTGPRSQELIASTDEDVPGAPPTDVQCTALSAYTILVLWSPPPEAEINGILLGYRVMYHALSNWDDLFTVDEQTTTENKIELLNLTPFCNYSIEVKAFTRKGDGVASRPIFCRTQEDVPGEPEDIKALVMDSRTILLSWRPPRYPNGRIKKYKVYIRSVDGVGMDRDQYDLPSEQTYYSISHLETHHRYELWVTAFTIVGESKPSRHVVQAPTNHVPARIASFSESITVAWKEELRLPCLTVGQPAPTLRWHKNGKTIQGNRHTQINSEGTVYISSIQSSDAGNYSCLAENVFGKEEIIYLVSVQESRSKGIPSAPTDFQATSHSTSTITVTWQPPVSKGSTIKGYYLHFKREFGEWEKIKIPAHDVSFTLNNLQCGTRHQFYLQAFNQLGQSSPTSTISHRTQGSAPVAPSIFDLIHVNSTSISLNVTSWGDGGCPITSFVVEYKLKHGVDWTLVSNNVKFDQTEFLVLDLNPETWYTLRMTAHNSAGSTIHKYDFVTLTHSGAIVAPELIIHSGYGQNSIFSDLGIIIPTGAALIIVVVSGAGFFLYMKRKQELYHANKYGEKPSQIGLVPDVQKTGRCESDTTAGGSIGCGAVVNSSPNESLCLPTPVHISLGRRQDISPYATFQVPNSTGSEGAVEHTPQTIDHCSHSQHIKGVNTDTYKYGSSADSVYTKICKKSQYDDDDAVDWIPLHSLYKSHRY